jgi:beta-glucosidase
MKIKPVIFGISGTSLTNQELNFFTENQIYGFILFNRNIESTSQLLSLVDNIKNIYPDRIVPIFVDQEGGRVARLRPPIAEKEYPSAESFAKIYDIEGKDAAIDAVKINYSDLMNELKTFGISSPCAPVADLRYSYTDNVIGNRSFGDDVEKVVTLCSSAAEAIEECGGIAIIKHIPGHGRAICDSHYELPRVTATLEDLNKTDFEVFRRLSNNEKVKWAMTAHIVFDALDNNLPVTLSKKAIDFIRSEIGFKGVLVSDAIEMHALHSNVNIEDKEAFSFSLASVARQSLEAGCDIVLHCTGDMSQMIAILEAI